MKNLIEKASILLEALPYLQKFRKKTFVIKLGGSFMEDNNLVKSVLRDAVFLENTGIRIFIVHGGGKAITRAMKRAGLKADFVEGLRITDKATIKIVEKVLVGKINAGLVKKINGLGGKAVGFSAADHGILEVRKQYVYKKENNKQKRIDIGFVGKINKIYTHPIYRLLNVDKIPVIAPLGIGPHGFVHNINADTAACEIAGRLKAEKLIFVTDVDGIFHGKGLISSLNIRDVEKNIRKNIIKSGMVPKARAMTKAMKKGVKKTHIINGHIPHSLLLEIYTDRGIGTELVK
jgi:acetylglutamate kinase